MKLRFWSLVLGVLVAGWGAGADAESRDRVSEWEPTPTEAWAEPGFRIQLRIGFDSVTLANKPAQRWFAFAAEPGVRLGRRISLSASLRYSLFEEGLHWTNTADVTFHVFHGFQVSVGAGYGGVMGADCDGGAGGLAALARATWLFPLGQVFSTGPAIQFQWQSPLACEDLFGERSFSSGFQATSIGWTLAWR